MTALQQGAIRAGLMMGGGLFIVRIAMAHGEVLLATGLTVLEIGSILFLEAKAKNLDKDITAWRTAHQNHVLAVNLSAAAEKEFERRRALVEEAEGRIATIEETLLTRSRNSDPVKAKAIAIAQAHAGYAARIAANKACGIVPSEVSA